MKTLNKMGLIIIMTINFMVNSVMVHAQSNTLEENQTSTTIPGWTHAEADKGVHLALDGAFLYGPISGYLQTPLGGIPSSASDKRLKFSELGIDRVPLFNLSLSASMDPHSIYASANLVNLNGETTLDETLVFHGRVYPAGAMVTSDVKLNWYEMGYRYNFHFGKERMNFNVAPSVSFALFDFSAQLESGGIKNDRSYVKGTPRIGLEFEWFPWNRFSIYGKGIGS